MLFSNDEQIKNSSFWRDLENSTFFLPLNLISFILKMRPLKFIHYILFVTAICLILFSCEKSKTTSHVAIGKWAVYENDKKTSVLEITEESLALYSISVTDCGDTSYYENLYVDSLKVTENENEVTIFCAVEDIEFEFFMTFSDNYEKGYLHDLESNKKLSFKRTQTNVKRKKPTLKVVFAANLRAEISHLEYSIIDISDKLTLTPEGIEVVNYIDSLRDKLLKEFNISYDNFKCLDKEDSLITFYTSSFFLIGEDPAMPKQSYFSGMTLEKKLTKYLINHPNKKAIPIIFDGFKENNFYNKEEPWVSYMFYNRPLGFSIIRLNELKYKILQLEKLSSNDR